jgi:hypothetical protein
MAVSLRVAVAAAEMVENADDQVGRMLGRPSLGSGPSHQKVLIIDKLQRLPNRSEVGGLEESSLVLISDRLK